MSSIAFDLMFRDIVELMRSGPLGFMLLGSLIIVPIFSVFIAVRRRRLIALAALFVWGAWMVAWYLFYATNWLDPESGEGGFFLLPRYLEWALLIYASLSKPKHAMGDGN